MRTKKKRQIRVYHAKYDACDSGCCGHVIEVEGIEDDFTFDHPPTGDTNYKGWALEMAKKHIALHHPECYDDIDWNSLDVDGVSKW